MSTETQNEPLLPTRWASIVAWWSSVHFLVVILVLSTVILYYPATGYELLNWDDPWYLTWNELLRSWHPMNLYQILTEPVARNYAPVTIFTFLVEYHLWGLHPSGYHATNVLLHAVNAVLVLQLIRQLTRNDWLSLAVALLFVVHPVQVESVAWISSRKTVLSSTFMLASLICWLRPERTSRQEGWGIIWLILGLLSKASCVVIPLIVIAYDVLIPRKKLSDAIVRQMPGLLFCAMLVFTTMNAQVTIVGGIRSHLGMSKLELLGVNLTLLWRYVFMLLVPRGLCVLYNPPVSGIGLLVTLSALGWGLVSWGLWKVRHTIPLVTFAGISALLIMIPMLNLFPLTTLMNDRYLYLTCIPFFAVVGGGIQWVWNGILRCLPQLAPAGKIMAATTILVVAGAMTWGTANYLPVWKNPVSLWTDARSKTPSLTVVQIQWALTMEEEGRPEEALSALKYALEHCNPDKLDRERIQKIQDRLRSPAEAMEHEA
ncbi:MAG TPA: hypothetical protein VNQ76_06440 [Planctomicrobium sp.]|nr:hypothetical protein [Planctomicrobium sp.]